MKKIKLAGIGCGGRTTTYFDLAAQMPLQYEVIAAADPIPERVEKARRLSRNPAFRGFASDAEILAEPRLADVMIIGTPDAHHAKPCLAAMEKGYDILLEKPIATSLREVYDITRTAGRLGRKVLVCHVLRYTPFYQKVKEIVDSGILGEIVTLNANEGVGAWHNVHGFVRGHYAVMEKATPMIVAKCCHDMDILAWLVDRPCLSVMSYGSLTHFTARNAPPGSPARCTDGCPVASSCPYNALAYLNYRQTWLSYVFDRPDTATDDEILDWLRRSPWGRCAYRCDNNVVDHQALSMRFEGDVTATFTMTAFETGRQIEIYGTQAKLRGGDIVRRLAGCDLIVSGLDNAWEQRISVRKPGGGYGGHLGGDGALVQALYDEMQKSNPAKMHTSIAKSVQSHLMAFAAEESRLKGQSIDLAQYAGAHGGHVPSER